MNIEEKVNREIWVVLKNIKEVELKTRENDPIDYWTSNIIIPKVGYPTPGDEEKILAKLEEMKVIKILNPVGYGEYE